MEEDPLQQAAGTVDERLASARDLLFRRRYRDALELINSVVLVLPSDPRAFLIRAAAFEGMDLIPQADADLEHARQLAAQRGLDFDALVNELNSPPPKPKKKRGEKNSGTPRPQPRHRPPSRGAGAGEFAIIIVFILFLAAAVGAGSYIVIGSLDINNDDDDGAAAANPTPTPAASAPTEPAVSATPAATLTPTRTPAPSLPPSVDGDPYSLSSIEAAWEAEGMTVTGGSAASGFSGFSLAPTSVSVSASGTSVDTAVFVYEAASAVAQDWTIVIGERPAAKPGRTVPSHFTIYWNTNVVIVVLDNPGALSEDLLNGVINMAP